MGGEGREHEESQDRLSEYAAKAEHCNKEDWNDVCWGRYRSVGLQLNLNWWNKLSTLKWCKYWMEGYLSLRLTSCSDAHMLQEERIKHVRRLNNWERLFCKVMGAKSHGRRWKFRIEPLKKKLEQQECELTNLILTLCILILMHAAL